MKMKRINFSFLLAICMFWFFSCRNNPDFVSLSAISYQKSAFSTDVSDRVQVKGSITAETGINDTIQVISHDFSGPFVIALMDWDDGTWSYDGPFRNTPNRTMKVTHTYNDPGDYKVKAMLINLQDGVRSEWSESIQVSVTGGRQVQSFINHVQAISSKPFDNAYSADMILDGLNNTYFKSEESEDLEAFHYVGLRFDKHYRLNTLEVKIPESASVFPTNIAVEYTTDNGKTWYSLPKYYYKYKYDSSWQTVPSMGVPNPLMNLPNPQGATLRFSLDGIIADGIRLCSKLYHKDNPDIPKYLAVEEMRATGDGEMLFYTSKGGTFDADLNNMYTIYGSAKSEPKVEGSLIGPNPHPFKTGCTMMTSTEWLEWDGIQHNWTDYSEALEVYRKALMAVPTGEDGLGNSGYVFATASAPKHLDVQYHYTYNQTFIIALRNWLLQRNDKEDVFVIQSSRGQTVSDRLTDAMNYMLTTLNGEEGLITIPDPANNGTATGKASNYWDAYLAFGYKSAFENAYFYLSLLAYADIQEYLGDTVQAAAFRNKAEKTKQAYTDAFWDADKGRFIMSIDVNGVRHDYGATFLNFTAVAYGLADREQAKLIYDWVDGKRIIKSDTSTGDDIYGAFKFSARSNTLDVAAIGPPYLLEDWGGEMACTPGGAGAWGVNIQNGGAIFYPQYYDMMGRVRTMSADNAMSRLKVIMEEFHKDELRRQGAYPIGGFFEGIIGEFPESGLVPLVFINGFIGLKTAVDGLTITPSLPDDMTFMGVRDYHYNGTAYAIEANRLLESPQLKKVADIIYIQVPATGQYKITTDNKILSLSDL